MVISFQFNPESRYLGLLCVSTVLSLRRRENLLLVLRDLGTVWCHSDCKLWRQIDQRVKVLGRETVT